MKNKCQKANHTDWCATFASHNNLRYVQEAFEIFMCFNITLFNSVDTQV